MFNPNIPPGNDYSPGQLRSTPSYIFQTGEILGEGATSKVFLGRHKKTGEKVAVKVFNHESFQRPNVVQEREFEVLHKIKHVNIVKLLAIENDQITKHRLIVLELCDCSVLNMLDQPKYIYGFPDKEFLNILGDTTSGMKYLQEQDIVHRDIKPGNIMRKLGPGRKPTYKLADFGAARQLQAEENFTSLYGTEEYLHPHMFERALLKKPLQKPFNAKVDLWSFGVTIYHIATGVLPFRPYGGRKNRNTMHKITTQKASGVISAVQRESEDGPIEYGTELPKNCRLSFGLRFEVTDILTGLLESNTDRMWSFETLFHMVQSILNKRALDVLSISTGQLIRVYIDPNSSFAEFQEHIAMQTSIPSDMQVHIYDHEHFNPDTTVTCASYPLTTEKDPIFLIPRSFKGSGSPIPPIAPSLPEIKSNYSLDSDYPLSRLCSAGIHFLQWKQHILLTITLLYIDVAKSIRSITKTQVMQLKIHLADVDSTKQYVHNYLKSVEDKATLILELVNSYSLEANGDTEDIKMIRQPLIGIQNEIAAIRRSFQLVTRKQSEASTKLSACVDPMTWHNTHRCHEDDRCRERLDVIREVVEEITKQYRRDRKVKNLGYNEIQIHKMDKLKLREQVTQAVSLLRDHCESNWRESHMQLMEWFRQTAPIQDNIRDVDQILTELINVDWPRLVEEVETKCAIWETRLQRTRQQLSDIMLKRSSSTQGTYATSTVERLTSSRTLGNGEPVIYHPPCSPKAGGSRTPRLIARGPARTANHNSSNANTITYVPRAPSSVSSTASHGSSNANKIINVPKAASSGSSTASHSSSNANTLIHVPKALSSVSNTASHTSSNANSRNMIPVLKALQSDMETYTATSAHTTKEAIAHSQQIMKQMKDVPLDSTRKLMEELNDMSLGIPDSEFNFVNHNME